MTDMIRTAAHGYAQRGWSVLPLHGVTPDGTCRCQAGPACTEQSRGKHPIRSKWSTIARFAGADIEEVWTAINPDANVGIRTGDPSGWWTLDIDPMHGGDVALAKLVEQHGELPPTWSQVTGSGGRHYAFLMPDFPVTNSPGRLPSGIDVRGTGGLIVAAPSVTGRGPYMVVNDGAVLAAPAWLLDLVRPTAIAADTVPIEDMPGFADVAEIARPRLTAYARAAIEGAIERYRSAKAGTGNASMFVAACQVIEITNSPWQPFTRGQAEQLLDRARQLRDRQTEAEFRATWSSALSRVAGRCRPLPDGDLPGGEFFPFAPGGDGTPNKLPPVIGTAGTRRRLKAVTADTIEIRPVDWVWEARIPAGVLTLLAGREGCGKSTVLYDRAAALTRGELAGRHYGTPRSVIICAGEDSWAHTIVPRLMAVGADLTRVYRVEVDAELSFGGNVSLPRDIGEMTGIVREHDVAMIILDPLMSMLDGTMKSNDYQAVYAALTPVMDMAEHADVAVVGIMHLNKSQGVDPLTRMMASRAFAAAPRSVLMAHQQAEDDDAPPGGPARYLLGHEKCNLGPKAPTLTYTIETETWPGTQQADGGVPTFSAPRIEWGGETTLSIEAAMSRSTQFGRSSRKAAGSAMGEAARFVVSHLTSVGGTDSVAGVREAATAAGHAWRTVQRAREDMADVVGIHRPGGNVGPWNWLIVRSPTGPH